ncbi:related to Probable ribokinase [Zygosaccharomyces bailii]|uniref:Ribokinase n=1 Tax=Zygosaccharomyces bailii (strain CLIB 213 / ATCC 58445 / CBS 680 / BCRC 21525 / NBRC 1098 / NCYC 1416 / NRRL Y-2227) TaxID=1333698 RepID=A0A8J2T687_ZYGB2|nr:ZYBA0S04-10616g1_1 [Zygosaccharomyces bailii CLIB 213]CDH13828.1 related to ribokinase [Zygosaccharomyces bailii ISA1307]SJM87574.1 related to Probable ribokinase [Zygosaccharomyces bailii]
MGITVIGSLNYDIVTFTDRVPQAGETLKGNFFETHAGGKGLNQTIALAKLKNNESPYSIKMVGSVGDDAFGKQLVNLLKENQIDVSDVQVVANKSTGVATIIVEQKNGGQNRIILTEGANGSSVYSDQELSQIFGGEGASPNRKQYVVFQNEIPHPCSIMTWIKKYRPDSQIVYNPSPFYPITKEQWSLVDILVINEVEALQIVEAVYDPKIFSEYKSKIGRDFLDGYKEICRDFQLHLVNQTNDAVVVITLGENGALYSSKQNPGVGYTSSVSGIKVVDTTAAGDTFLGALITQLHQGVTLGRAIEFATKASSIGIQRSGAAESIPSFKEVA